VTTVLVSDDRRIVREELTRVMSAVDGILRVEGISHELLLMRYARQPVDLVLVGAQRSAPTGVDIARRTVAKYREAMRIPSSVQRRREKLRWELRRTSQGWHLQAPSNRAYIPRDVAVHVLAEQLALLTQNEAASGEWDRSLHRQSTIVHALGFLFDQN